MEAIFPRGHVSIVLPSGLYLPHGQEDRDWMHALVGSTPMPWQRWSLPFAKAQSVNREEWQRWTWTVLTVGILILMTLLPQVASVEVRPAVCLCSITLLLGFFMLSKLDKESHQQKWRGWKWSGRKPKPKLDLLCTGGDHCHQYFGIFLFFKMPLKSLFPLQAEVSKCKGSKCKASRSCTTLPRLPPLESRQGQAWRSSGQGFGEGSPVPRGCSCSLIPWKEPCYIQKMKLQKKAWWEEWKYHADK